MLILLIASSHTTPVNPIPFTDCFQVQSSNPNSPHRFQLTLNSLQYRTQGSLTR